MYLLNTKARVYSINHSTGVLNEERVATAANVSGYTQALGSAWVDYDRGIDEERVVEPTLRTNTGSGSIIGNLRFWKVDDRTLGARYVGTGSTDIEITQLYGL